MSVRKTLMFLSLTCVALSIFTSLTTYYVTYKDAHIGGPTITYHGMPLHWMIEVWPMPRPIPGPVLPTFSPEPLNFLIDTLLYTILYTLTAFLILHATTRRRRLNS